MKRANVLRLVAILAVVVLASMTTGCLKASISLEVEPPTGAGRVLGEVGKGMDGKMTVIATGVGKAGMYSKLTVEFFDGATPATSLGTATVDVQVFITPWDNQPQAFSLADYTDLVVPVGADAAVEAKFTLEGGGLALTPIFDTVDVEIAPADEV